MIHVSRGYLGLLLLSLLMGLGGCVKSLNKTAFRGTIKDETRYPESLETGCQRPAGSTKDIFVHLVYNLDSKQLVMGSAVTDEKGEFLIFPNLPKETEKQIRKKFDPKSCELKTVKRPFTGENTESNYIGNWKPSDGPFKPETPVLFKQNGALQILVEIGDELKRLRPSLFVKLVKIDVQTGEEIQDTKISPTIVRWEENEKVKDLKYENVTYGKYVLQFKIEEYTPYSTGAFDVCPGMIYNNDWKPYKFERSTNIEGIETLLVTLEPPCRGPWNGETSVARDPSTGSN